MTTGATHIEVLDFIAGCETVASLIEGSRADIVLFPLRGAGPIRWCVEDFIDDRPSGKKPIFVDLPIGTHITINEREPHDAGIRPSEKRAVIKDVLDDLERNGKYIPGESRLMMVDEVQKGGTISRAALEVSRAMRERGDETRLSITAVQDIRRGFVGMEKTDNFRKMVANENPRFRTSLVPLALFTVDRASMLDQIWKLPSGRVTAADDLEVQPNEPARRMFKALIAVYKNPKAALQELEALRRSEIAQNLGQTIVQQEVLEAITDPRLTRDRASETHVVNWWYNFAKIAQKSGFGTDFNGHSKQRK